MNPAKQSHAILELEGLRGLLALCVLFGHWGTTISQKLAPLAQNLWSMDAVDVFIILSGFVIFSLLSQGVSQGPAPYRHYLIRRWFRLWPTFLVVMVAAALLLPVTEAALLASPASFMKDERLLMVADSRAHLGFHFLTHLLMLHGLVPEGWNFVAPYTLIGQGWSISLEWQFYLLAPLFYLLLTCKGLGYKLALAALVAALLVTADYFSKAYLGNKIGYFALGYISFRLWDWYRLHGAQHSLMRARVMVLAVAIGTLLLRDYGGLASFIWSAVFGMILLSRHPQATLEKRLCAPLLYSPSQFLGRISYTLYLVHFQVMVLVLYGLQQLTLGETQLSAALLIGTVMFAIPLAALVSRFIEQPCIQLGKRLVGRKV